MKSIYFFRSFRRLLSGLAAVIAATLFSLPNPLSAGAAEDVPLPVFNSSPKYDAFFTPEMEKAVESVLSRMTLDEKLKMLQGDIEGAAPPSRGSAAIPRLELGSMVFYNGPRGYQVGGKGSTLFPNGTGQAASFQPALVGRIGAAIAREFLADHWQVLEAPSMNIIRDPLNGRNFEYFTEDPYLNGAMVADYIQGVQGAGAIASAKHFIANNRETNREQLNAVIGERALREIYLPGFKAACDAGVLSIMTGANRVNGPHSSDNPMLINILKREWGWPGFLYTDWNGVQTTEEAFNAGLDLSMPGRPHGPWSLGKLKKAWQAGRLDGAALDDKVRRLLRGAFFSGRLPGAPPSPDVTPDLKAHELLAREAAQAGMVLVRNEDETLPIGRKVKKIAVLGPMAECILCKPGFGGSAAVWKVPYEIKPLDGLRNRFGDRRITHVPFSVNEMFEPIAAPCVFHRNAKGKKVPGFEARYTGRHPNTGKPGEVDAVLDAVDINWEMASPERNLLASNRFDAEWTGVVVPPADGNYTLRIEGSQHTYVSLDGEPVVDIWLRQNESEVTLPLEKDREYEIKVHLIKHGVGRMDTHLRLLWMRPDAQDRLERILDRSADAAAKADAAIVIIGQDHNKESEGMDRHSMRLPEYQDLLVERVLEANPRTVVVVYAGAPVAMDPWFDKVPAVVLPWFPGIENGNALASLLAGDEDFSGRMPVTFPKRYADSPAAPERQKPDKAETIDHSEGIFVGYRWYDAKGIDPLIPFGHGLSYATFSYGKPVVTKKAGAEVHVSVPVRNTSDRIGTEVVQLYVHQESPLHPRPPRELKGFVSVELAPGETQTVEFDLGREAFSYWNPDTREWTLAGGGFEIQIGRSSRDIVHCVSLEPGSGQL